MFRWFNHLRYQKRTNRKVIVMKIQMTVLLLLAAGFAMAQNDNSGRKPPTAAELISKLDKDGDGKISASEFDGPSEHFTRFDKNGDGYLSEDEIPSGPPPRGDR